MASGIILYKNAARVGAYVDCTMRPLAFASSAESRPRSVADAIAANLDSDCLVPHGQELGKVVCCKLKVRVCNERGEPCADAARSICPDLLFRTDRGPWSAFHENSVFLLPASFDSLTLQVATKERSNVMRGAMVLEFFAQDTAIARSETLLVLSKPPAASKRFPFARLMAAGAASRAGIEAAPCSQARLGGGSRVLVPEAATKRIAPWVVHALGAYRARLAPIAIASACASASTGKRARDDPEDLRAQLSALETKLAASEAERAKVLVALRLLAPGSAI